MLNASKLELYIGSHPDDPGTEVSDSHLDHAYNLMRDLFPQGFTMAKGYGYWDSVGEGSIIVTVVREGGPIITDLLREQVSQVAEELEQMEILMCETPVYCVTAYGKED